MYFNNFQNRHKVFISYHHENDQNYRDKFEYLFSNQFDIMVSKSVQIGDIDPNNNTEYVRQQIRDNYIADATVIIVLIGTETWKRKHVDWEISSAIRKTENNSRCGLLGIFLPSYPLDNNKFNHRTIPPRLYDNWNKDNFNNGERYAELHDWTKSPQKVSNWIHEAFKKRDTMNPINNRPMFGKNRSGDGWSD